MESGLHVAGGVVIRQSGVEVETQSGVALDRGLPSQALVVWSCSATRAQHHYGFALVVENPYTQETQRLHLSQDELSAYLISQGNRLPPLTRTAESPHVREEPASPIPLCFNFQVQVKYEIQTLSC